MPESICLPETEEEVMPVQAQEEPAIHEVTMIINKSKAVNPGETFFDYLVASGQNPHNYSGSSEVYSVVADGILVEDFMTPIPSSTKTIYVHAI